MHDIVANSVFPKSGLKYLGAVTPSINLFNLTIWVKVKMTPCGLCFDSVIILPNFIMAIDQHRLSVYVFDHKYKCMHA